MSNAKKTRLATVEEQKRAIADYKAKHGTDNFNGITLFALYEKFGAVEWIPGKGFEIPDL